MGNRNYLIITEGEKDEKNVFETIFEKYGFNIVNVKQKMNIDNIGQFEKINYKLESSNIVLIQGPRNRIHDVLKLFDERTDSIERAFSFPYGFFAGIFLVYDVDHNNNEDVERMFNKFQDEVTGMLLLSSPCFEVIGDYNLDRKEARYTRLKEYKKDLNNYYGNNYQTSTIQYIANNFDKLIIRFLKENVSEFGSKNVMEHPSFIVKKINEMNIRYNAINKEESYVLYRYFSTVIYVAIAQANNLTKEIDNYSTVLEFFLKYS